MILHEESKILIMGNRKCGSSSIHSRFLSLSDVETPFVGSPKSYSHIFYKGQEIPLNDEDRDFFKQHFKHMPASRMRYLFAKIGLDFDAFDKIVVIRNPYDRVISDFTYHLRVINENLRSERAEEGVNRFFFKRHHHEDALDFFTGVRDGDYASRRFHVVRAENLEAEIRRVFERLPNAEAFLDRLQTPLERRNRTPEELASRVNVLSGPAITLINEIFAEDFRVGGYEMIRPRLANPVPHFA